MVVILPESGLVTPGRAATPPGTRETTPTLRGRRVDMHTHSLRRQYVTACTRDMLRELGRVTAALLHEKGSIAPVDVFLRFGSLTPADDERWRRGQILVLERVIQINLTRITCIMQALRRLQPARASAA